MASVVLALLVAEVAFRILAPSVGGVDRERLQRLRAFVCDGESALYEPRAHTVFVRKRGRPGTNSLGFRGPEWPLEMTPGVPRVLLVGASTTESTNPDALARAIRTRSGVAVEVLNAGVSGWTTAESMVNWFLLAQDYRPDVVVLHHGVNDVPPRFRRGHRPDYSHFRRPWSRPDVNALERALVRVSDLYAWHLSRNDEFSVQRATTLPVVDSMHVSDTPLPFAEGANTYVRNLRTIGRHAESLGADVVVMTMAMRGDDRSDYDTLMRRGLLEHNERARTLAAEQGWQLFDFERDFARAGGAADAFSDLVHLTPGARETRSRMLADAIAAQLATADRE